MTASLASGSYGSGHEDLGERAAMQRAIVWKHAVSAWKTQDKFGWKKYGCFDKINEDLQLAPMWCDDEDKRSAFGDPLYPFRNGGNESERNVFHIAGVAL